ncbi:MULTISPECIES: DUF6602 domain-containing protein [Aeromonas]|jgi:hypothetical protein|uniref:DUF6602 domain-containing protein n=2 Tax=Aeromonas TaxID=642 RepID=A0ABT7Q6K4_9GAMM|nr:MULTISPECIES: DUF6602 domain-containing protein [Aeromonas]HDO1330875.1 hypothetical protein [Aeromonas veronii]MDM5129564.1 hypothetical protein [Aeromonas piscicola]HDO1335518.1 hypothetical protein [Aeromonas veronii]HDO1339283.1 hypothetical protein [Aeromonas veronii]HDO1344431.1 hypothetical protein [Aeromonas veronii]
MSSVAKTFSNTDGKEFLKNSFSMQQKVLQSQLAMSSATITHNGTMGEVNEQYFIEIIKKYLPDRYAVDTGIVIDSNGKTSDQIDVIIFDNQYTPTLLDQQGHRFIPAESVYAVLEVKPKIDKGYLEYAAQKAESVRVLHRTSVGIPHAGGIYPPKQHFEIIAGIVATDIDWADGFGEAFLRNHKTLNGMQRLDCGLAVSGGCFDIFSNDSSMKLGPVDNSLIYFLFRLLQKLQSLGTVPAIDWNEYAEQLVT